MLVQNWMSKNVIAIDSDDSMQRAIKLLKEHKINMLPVLHQGKLVGVVSELDLKRASASDATLLEVHELAYLISKIKVKDIMTKDPVTVPPDYTVEEAAALLMNRDISGLPVVDAAGQLVGVITRYDLFEVLVSLSGLGLKGVQFAFQLEDRPGSIKELTDVVRRFGGRIGSILGSYEGVPAGFRRVYIRAYNLDREKLPQLIEELKAKAAMLYFVDHRENRREIYQ